jgi:hypothetical protein
MKKQKANRPQTRKLGSMMECALSRDRCCKVILFTATDVMLFRGGNVVLKEKGKTESI